MRRIPLAITEHRCPCGARRSKTSRLCRKCSARARWHRHKAWRTSKNLSSTAPERSEPAMTVSIPLVAIFGILAFVAYRYMGLRAWHATVALIFGFLLAATTAAPEIRNLLSSVVTWLNKP